MSYECRRIKSDHRDLIHDVAFNWFGNQLATCSSDQSIKVWTLDSETNEWECTGSWKSHSGSVWKVTWAHPEFGHVLAACSFDRSASIWEEIPADSNSIPIPSQNLSQNGEEEPEFHWVKRTSLVDSRTSVTDVKFAPKILGLMLATCSADGVVRIYEATDIMNLSHWTLQHEIPCKVSLSCLSWNHCITKLQPPMIAVGSEDTNRIDTGKVLLYEYNETVRKWLHLETVSTITDIVHDIAFAPSIGRSYSVLAVAAKDLRIITLKPDKSNESLVSDKKDHQPSGKVTKYEIKLAGKFNDHASAVWRVCWNVTGTILASSGDDGQVRIWKSNYLDIWSCVASLRGDGRGLARDPGGGFHPAPTVNNSNVNAFLLK